MRGLAWLLPLIAPLLVRCVGDDEPATCWSNEDCAAGTYCEGAVHGDCGGGHTGTCTERLGPGESCAAWQDSCRAGLVCHLGHQPPRCEPPSPLGGACGWDQDCDDDLDGLEELDDPVCVGADPPVVGVCAAAGSTPTGGACEEGRACAAPDNCYDGACRGPGAEGETCAAFLVAEDRPPCAPGLYCEWRDDDVCRPYVAEGERCTPDGDRCAEGLFCYSQEAVCHAPLGAGDACLVGDVCASGLFCSSRAICVPPLAEGEACWGDDHCADGLFCYSREAICHAPLATGEPCEPFHDVCSEGLVCDRAAEVCRRA